MVKYDQLVKWIIQSQHCNLFSFTFLSNQFILSHIPFTPSKCCINLEKEREKEMHLDQYSNHHIRTINYPLSCIFISYINSHFHLLSSLWLTGHYWIPAQEYYGSRRPSKPLSWVRSYAILKKKKKKKSSPTDLTFS